MAQAQRICDGVHRTSFFLPLSYDALTRSLVHTTYNCITCSTDVMDVFSIVDKHWTELETLRQVHPECWDESMYLPFIFICAFKAP